MREQSGESNRIRRTPAAWSSDHRSRPNGYGMWPKSRAAQYRQERNSTVPPTSASGAAQITKPEEPDSASKRPDGQQTRVARNVFREKFFDRQEQPKF